MRGREEGYILVVVLVFTAALFVLLAAFGPLSSANLHQAVRQELQAQAHYLARSGAAAVASAIMEKPTLAQELLDLGLEGTGQMDTGTFSVEVEELPDESIVIHSSGTVKGENSNVSLVLYKVDTDYMDHIFDRAIFSCSDLDISHQNTEIYGSVESAGKVIVKENPTINPETGEPYAIIEHSKRTFPPPLFPGDIEQTNKTLYVKNHCADDYSIAGDAYYKRITVDQHGTLVVNTGEGGARKIIRLVVEEIECKGLLSVTGEGRLLLYVHNRAEIQTPHSDVEGAEGRLIVFLRDNASCQIIANGTFQGYIYGPGATVGIQSDGTVYGAIIARNVVRMVGTSQSVHGKVFHEDIMENEELAEYFQSSSAYALGYWNR